MLTQGKSSTFCISELYDRDPATNLRCRTVRAYDHIFPTHKIVSAADLQKVKKEKALASSETDGEVRNLFRSVAAKGRDFQTSNSMTLGGLSGSNESRIAESDTALQDGFAQEGQS